MTDENTASDAKTGGPKLWQRDHEHQRWLTATPATIIAALQANPQLRAEVLEHTSAGEHCAACGAEWMTNMQLDRFADKADPYIERARKAESELAAERARVVELRDWLDSQESCSFGEECAAYGKAIRKLDALRSSQQPDQKPAATTEEQAAPAVVYLPEEVRGMTIQGPATVHLDWVRCMRDCSFRDVTLMYRGAEVTLREWAEQAAPAAVAAVQYHCLHGCGAGVPEPMVCDSCFEAQMEREPSPAKPELPGSLTRADVLSIVAEVAMGARLLAVNDHFASKTALAWLAEAAKEAK